MTGPNAIAATTQGEPHFVFPDPPGPEERGPDDMTTFDHLSATGTAHHLMQHLGNPETTLVAGEHYLAPIPVRDLRGIRYPDLLIAFDVDPAAYRRSNAYVVSEQGKPPDFVLEIASRSTGDEDTGPKLRDYEALGVPEYWRFDETGEFHHTRLAGDRLVDGQYLPIDIEEQPDGSLQGYSQVLNLYLRWEQGQFRLHDPATGRHIATFEDERARADKAEARADNAEARARELEEELRRLRGD